VVDESQGLNMTLCPVELHVMGSPLPYLVDRSMAAEVARYKWHYDPKLKRARAIIQRGGPRIMLHKYLLSLKGIRWVEVYFNNGNCFDCRLVNLVPYRRNEEGARRKVFKNKKVPFKGVSRRGSGKYVASIRANGHLKHLGYFTTPEAAADAYEKAYSLLHSKTDI
jgi:hypothetical protein